MKNFFRKVLSPVSVNEDRARSEFIFHILLLGTIFLSFSAFLLNFRDVLRGLSPSVSVWVIFVILIFFISLFFLSKKGYSLFASIIFCGIFFTLNSYTAFRFGVDIPAGLLTYSLIIIMVGVLMGTRFAFGITLVTIFTVLLLGYLQVHSENFINAYWRSETTTIADVLLFSVIFLIIAIVSWLSNREIEKSLKRAQRSEAELIIERDSLEIKVEERTRAIKEMQLEKMGQLYRFAEFGRLSSGLFHDLVNPLMAVSLNMEIVKSKESTIDKESDISTYLGRALSATRKMEDFVLAVRKQISKQEHLSLFSLNEEVKQVIEILSFKATKAGVSFVFHESAAIEMYGDNIKYSQVVLNLLVNAIDSYRNSIENDQVVIVSLSKRERSIIFSVKDSGSGIAPDTMSKIFEPFFSTKASNPDSGMGIGLSLVKKIVEKDFGGTIEVVSMVGEGTEFICRFPYSQK